jgi:signal transduction histidine kinase
MARPLQRLRSRSLDIAEHRLPEAVEQLSTSEGGDLDVQVEPIGIRSRDEIGQVAQAVDAIQQVAVRLATEQAALRRSIGDMFTNLARRSQTLIDRQLELIEDLERNEEAPETLEHLFRLDHLATRMRRNAEDLIVLSGAEPGRHWAQPMTLVDVVRAATAEVEEYQRVELLPMADLEVAGSASIDVIHLLAELVENATVFSPPNTKVQIAGQALPHGYVIEIEDRGLGMSEEELLTANERLANPPEIDFALARVLGLYVVGRLAQRHGIRVQLRHSWYGGVTALTLLPHSILVWPDEPRAIPEHLAVAPAELPSPPDRLAPPERLEPRKRLAAEPAHEPAAEAGDHLPIFEAARSDWFVAEGQTEEPQPSPPPPPPPPRPSHPTPPLRQPASAIQEPQAPVGAGATAAPAVDGPAPPFRPSTLQRPYATPTPEPRPDDQETHAVPVTQAGLPRRIPRANLAPGMTADPPDAPETRVGRSPDEVRSILSSYRSGLERGRLAAGDLEGDLPDEAP